MPKSDHGIRDPRSERPQLDDPALQRRTTGRVQQCATHGQTCHQFARHNDWHADMHFALQATNLTEVACAAQRCCTGAGTRCFTVRPEKDIFARAPGLQLITGYVSLARRRPVRIGRSAHAQMIVSFGDQQYRQTKTACPFPHARQRNFIHQPVVMKTGAQLADTGCQHELVPQVVMTQQVKIGKDHQNSMRGGIFQPELAGQYRVCCHSDAICLGKGAQAPGQCLQIFARRGRCDA